jgi:hypothetical protein
MYYMFRPSAIFRHSASVTFSCMLSYVLVQLHKICCYRIYIINYKICAIRLVKMLKCLFKIFLDSNCFVGFKLLPGIVC